MSTYAYLRFVMSVAKIITVFFIPLKGVSFGFGRPLPTMAMSAVGVCLSVSGLEPRGRGDVCVCMYTILAWPGHGRPGTPRRSDKRKENTTRGPEQTLNAGNKIGLSLRLGLLAVCKV